MISSSPILYFVEYCWGLEYFFKQRPFTRTNEGEVNKNESGICEWNCTNTNYYCKTKRRKGK